jgi:Ca2+-binding RTX toxin-like protein
MTEGDEVVGVCRFLRSSYAAIVVSIVLGSSVAPASAAPLAVGGSTEGGGTVQASVDDGEGHIVTVAQTTAFGDLAYLIFDPAGVVPVIPSCSSQGSRMVTCPASGIDAIDVRTGSGRDAIRFPSIGTGDVAEAHAGPGPDKLIGSREHGDQLHGDAGADQIFGMKGNDALYGGGGRDRLEGGRGRDAFDAGAGADRVLATDGDVDQRILCGGGSDTAVIDRIDVLRSGISPLGCERLARKRSGAKHSA